MKGTTKLHVKTKYYSLYCSLNIYLGVSFFSHLPLTNAYCIYGLFCLDSNLQYYDITVNRMKIFSFNISYTLNCRLSM